MKYIILTTLMFSAASWAGDDVDEIAPSGNLNTTIAVRLVPFDPMWTDTFVDTRSESLVRTGHFWTAVFSSSESIDETFEITHARLENISSRGSYLYAYHVEGELACGEDRYPVKAQGSRSSFMRPDRAKAEAIERAIGNVVDALNGHLRRCRINSASRSTPTRSTVEVYDELLRLKDLMDKGILTHEEFETQKKKLLEST